MSEQQRLSPDELVARLATMANVTPDQARAVLQAQAELAPRYVRHARDQYPVPGIGVLQLVDFAASSLVMQFGPKKGQTVAIPAKKRLKFRVCKMMKEIVLGNPKGLRDPVAMPDLFDPAVLDITWYPPDYEPED